MPAYTPDADELLDIVNERDEVVGEIARVDSRQIADGGDQYIRCVSGFIRRQNGEIWVPVRNPHKSIAPNGLDYSFGGFVPKGESYKDAVFREAMEETGISISPAQIHHITKNRLSGTPQFFEALFIVDSDEQLQLSGEHVSGSWMLPEAVIAAINQGTPAKSSLLVNLTTISEQQIQEVL